MEVPFQRLSADALLGLVREFVTRDGTDYGEQEVPLEAKIRAVMQQLERGEVVVVFDSESQSCTIVTRGALTQQSKHSAEEPV
jgi:uncharacterized protein YheU (UPF0270 family)